MWAALICPKRDIGGTRRGESPKAQESQEPVVGGPLVLSIARNFLVGPVKVSRQLVREEKRTKFQLQRPSGAGESGELFYSRRS